MLVCRLSHYLFTVTESCGLDILDEDLTDFANAHRLPPGAQEEIFRLAFRELGPINLLNQIMFYDEAGRVIGGADYEVRSVVDVQEHFFVPSHTTILDTTVPITHVLVFKKSWLDNNYLKPMKKYRPLKRIVKEDPTSTLAGLMERIQKSAHNSVGSSTGSVGSHGTGGAPRRPNMLRRGMNAARRAGRGTPPPSMGGNQGGRIPYHNNGPQPPVPPQMMHQQQRPHRQPQHHPHHHPAQPHHMPPPQPPQQQPPRGVPPSPHPEPHVYSRQPMMAQPPSPPSNGNGAFPAQPPQEATPIATATPVGGGFPTAGFQPGQMVQLTNLRSADMNGCAGIVEGYVQGGRVNVRLSKNKLVCVKPENLEVGAEMLD